MMEYFKSVCRSRIAAYGILVGGVILAIALYQRHTDIQIKDAAYAACLRNNVVALNQKLVLRTLIDDRRAEKGFLLFKRPSERRRSVSELNKALHAVPVHTCKR